MLHTATLFKRVLAILLMATLASCGGGGNSSWQLPQGQAQSPAPAPLATHIVGGSVTGLAGTGLVLQNNAGDDLAISADGRFAFAGAIATGGSYAVTVKSAPSNPEQVCSVSQASGTVGEADVADIAVVCATSSYTLGGTVVGLAGTGLVLLNGTEEIAVSADGNFSFPTAIASGASYAVTVKTQPGSPTQVCTVNNAAGTISTADITNLAVVCATSSFTVGGNLSGLDGVGLVLQNNAGDDIVPAADGSFTFPQPVASGAAYAITVKTQPSLLAQTCTVGNGGGTIAAAAITNVTVQCTTPFARFAYIAQASGVQAYSIDTALQQFTPMGALLAMGAAPTAIAVDPLSRFAFVTDANGDISTLGINATTGAVQLKGKLVRSDPGSTTALAVDPTGKFLYMLVGSSGEIYGYSIDPTDGTLQLVVFPTPTGTDTRGLTVDPTGRFLYAAVHGGPPGSGMIRCFSVNPATGALTMTTVPAKPTLNTPLAIAADPSGKYIYVSTEASNATEAYAINQATGNLTLVGTTTNISAADADSIAIHPRGTMGYVGSRSIGTIAYDELAPATGAPTYVAISSAALNVLALAADPNGRFLYFLSSGSLRLYTLDPLTGSALTVGGGGANPVAAVALAIAK